MLKEKNKVAKISRFNNHWFYRLIKLGYGILFIGVSGSWLIDGNEIEKGALSEYLPTMAVGLVVIMIIFLIIQKLFYYVVFGTLFPKRILKKVSPSDFEFDKYVKNTQKNNKGMNGLIILVTLIIGATIIISAIIINSGTGSNYKTRKTVFEICYNECSNLGQSLDENGECPSEYHLVDNDWCVEDGREDECIRICK